jgi:hypothetical protein
VSKKKPSRKDEVAELAREAERADVQEPEVHPVVEEKEETEEESPGETATPKLVTKRKGRQPVEGKALRRLLVFMSDEDLEKLKEDGRPLSTIAREAIKEWIQKNRK